MRTIKKVLCAMYALQEQAVDRIVGVLYKVAKPVHKYRWQILPLTISLYSLCTVVEVTVGVPAAMQPLMNARHWMFVMVLAMAYNPSMFRGGSAGSAGAHAPARS